MGWHEWEQVEGVLYFKRKCKKCGKISFDELYNDHNGCMEN